MTFELSKPSKQNYSLVFKLFLVVFENRIDEHKELPSDMFKLESLPGTTKQKIHCIILWYSLVFKLFLVVFEQGYYASGHRGSNYQ